MFECSKRFGPFPCAHRNHYHSGVCSLVHGYAISFVCTFQSNSLSDEGFVTDFGNLHAVRHYLHQMYDHKIVLSYNDPYLHEFEKLESQGLMSITTLKKVSMEYRAMNLVDYCMDLELPIIKVTVLENEKNAGAFYKSR